MCIVKIIIFIVLLGLIAGIHCNWEYWGGGNNGIHSRPVIRTTPNILWSHSSTSIVQGINICRVFC